MEQIKQKWKVLKGRNQTDSLRIYLTCVRKWPFFGAKLYPAKVSIATRDLNWPVLEIYPGMYLNILKSAVYMLDFMKNRATFLIENS